MRQLTAVRAILAVACCTTAYAHGLTVDADLPAGNIVVDGIDGDTVKVRQDLRDSSLWFYWAFRVKGAAGRTLTFDFTDKRWGGPVGVRGPVVSNDGGRTFSYPLDGKSRRDGFTYTFGANDDEVQFYECHPYVRANWDTFVARMGGHAGRVTLPANYAIETLCRSRKGADVPCARFGCIGREPKFRIFMSARHHCSETMADWVLEGVGEAFLADDDLGRWLRENVELMMVPFVDYDGAQAGDQGKLRKPHDHNRDYMEFIYPETKAITDWIAKHAHGRLDMFIDVHCPWIRGKYNEWLYTPWKDPKILPDPAAERWFSELLEMLQCGSMRYRAANDLPFGKEWNTGKNYSKGWSAVIWACNKVKGLKIARSYEVPFANANGAVVTPETCRALGRDTAKVFRAMLDGDAVGTRVPRVRGHAGRVTLPCISGVYPHLAMFNDEGECGTGAVVPWAGSLWVVTYGPHCPLGSTDKLYRIKPDLTRETFEGSVGGTHANRMVHRETNQLLIGPYVIDATGGVRVIPPAKMPGRLTGAARHLTDPAGKVYVATMETGLYELDMRTLAVNTLIREDGMNDKAIRNHLEKLGLSWPEGWSSAPLTHVPGYHSKGLASGFGRVFISNNGENSPAARRNPFVPSGVLAWWNEPGRDWTTIRRCQFTEVTSPDGIYGNEHPGANPIWAMGWDAKSVIFGVTTNGTEWAYYRLPKASHAYDGAHGWNTEWPRIREAGLGDGALLATMHGTFWRFPRGFSPASPNGIRPISTYLKVIGDFCWWKDAPGGGAIVFGCDDQAKNEFLGKRGLKKDAPRCVRSQSNLWFVKPDELKTFGPPSGEGYVWRNEDVKAGDVSDPYLHAGYGSMRFSFVRADGSPVRYEMLMEGDWVRVKCLEDAKGATARFDYGPASCAPPPLVSGDPIAVVDDNGRTWHFPNVNGDTNVVCREIATERDLLYVGGVWYEVPAENAGGFAALRPVALADEPVRELRGERGLMYLNGKPMAIDDLWKNGTAPKAYWLWMQWQR
ncbi:MAG: hypothetical protein IKO72_15570 [Kiritimatiellae bacterium]|nr:hypothetical protein [Kiritimatiellia bacterium]